MREIKREPGSKYQILISGELNEAYIENKFKPLLKEKDLKHLYIKVEFLINLNKFKHFLNDFLFRLCYSRYLYIQGEHHFLDPKVKIWFEVATYHSNFLFDQLNFLQCLPDKECEFNLDKFEFSEDCLSDEQIVGLTLLHIVKNKSNLFLDYGGYIKEQISNVDREKWIDNYPTIWQIRKYKHAY